MTPIPTDRPLTAGDVPLLREGDVTCSACRRPITECVGENICEGAAKGQAEPYPPGRDLVAYDDEPSWYHKTDYRTEALSRDPQLTCSIERMCGSFNLAYVVRNRHDRQVHFADSERGAWAGASGATQNSRYDPEAPFEPWTRKSHATISASTMWKEYNARKAAR